MNKIKLISILVVGVALALLVMQNTAPVYVRFLWLAFETAGIVLLALTAFGGFILGVLVTFLVTRNR
jgi:uncharacterized integral membrane protein